jgi:hypothetical protein
MGIEIPTIYGGPESTFFNVILVVEELGKVENIRKFLFSIISIFKVDPSVSVFVDVQVIYFDIQ